jgi:hypothetical protein
MTALHYMLKKGSPEEHVRMLIRHGARVDLRNRAGVTAGEILARKRSPGLKKISASLRVT